MSILLDENTRVVVQGIGRQGTFHARRNVDYGTKIVAGTHPKKAGGTWEELDLPIFRTAGEAAEATGANASMILVPAPFARDAMLEAADAGVDLIVCLTEGIPVHDMTEVYNTLYPRNSDGTFTKQGRPVLIGPNCPGLISPGKANLGFIPESSTKPGPVGLVSRSGTLTYQIMHELYQAGRDGETLVVMGQSGSGKSVMLKLIVGLLAPDRGEVWVDGQEVSRFETEELYRFRKKVGFVFQFAALFDSMNIEENVGMGLRRMGGLSRGEIRDRVEECLALVDLEGFGNKLPAELSGGQKKRAGIARAIATRPDYLLYDEPTTGLDPVTRAVIDRLILRTSKEMGVTGVVVTHDMESAYRVADRIAMLYEGTSRFLGTPDELRETEDPVVKGFIEGRPELLENGTAGG